MNAITKATSVALLISLGWALAARTAETPAAAVGRAHPLAAYWEAQWDLLGKHVTWAKGGPMVPYWGSGPHEPTYKPVMLVGGKPDAPYRPGDGVDIDKAYLDNHCLIWETDRDALDVVLRRTRALLEGLRQQFALKLDDESKALGALEKAAKSEALGSPQRKELFVQASAAQRRIALSA